MTQKKKLTAGILTFVLSIITALLAMIPISGNTTKKADPWMSKLPDTAKLHELSLPGTHNSGATHSIFDLTGRCQDMSIKKQLNIGVRFFDIRLQLVKDKLNIVHSFIDQKQRFSSTIKELYTFIKNNPSEFLIISIKQEEASKKSTKSFENALIDTLTPYTDVVDTCVALPQTVKDACGKIFIISRYKDNTIGVSAGSGWKDSTTFTLNGLYIQDNYCIDEIDIKKKDIISTIEYSTTNTQNIVLNFLSCYIDGAFPPSYAVTPAKEINPWAMEVISNVEGSVGIIIADFITTDMAKIIYGRNFL